MAAFNQRPETKGILMRLITPKLRWFQFSLKLLLVLMLLVSIGMSWVAVRLQRARRQKEAAECLVRLGWQIEYDCQIDEKGNFSDAKPPQRGWLRSFLGDDFFDHARRARVPVAYHTGLQLSEEVSEYLKDLDAALARIQGLSTLEELYLDTQMDFVLKIHRNARLERDCIRTADVGMERIATLVNLKKLSLQGTPLTDAGVKHLERLPGLKQLDLSATRITDAALEHLMGLISLQQLKLPDRITDEGVNKLRQALPSCKILK